MIACLLIPYFAAAVERQTDLSLATTPLVLSESRSASEQVFAVSVEAAQYGIKPDMALRQAQTLCPQARFIPAKPTQYQRTFKEILSLLATFTTKVEPGDHQLAAIIYSDLGRLANTEQLELAEYLGQMVQERTHLAPALGLATGKFPAYVAARSIGLRRILFIAPGQESSFLAPLSVTHLPLDQELMHRFRLLGLRTLGQLAALSAGAVLTQFGQHGRWLHQLARGSDDRPVQAHRTPFLEQVTHQFEDPVSDRTVLAALGRTIALELAVRLEARGQAVRILELILNLADQRQWEEQLVLRQPTSSPDRLVRNLGRLIDRLQLSSGVVELTVKAADLVPIRAEQLDLFNHQNRAEQEKRIYTLLPDLIARYGSDCFAEVMLTNQLAHLPERRFSLRAVEGR
jgi:nucleotidyltransferase/DNA polymerase involved in DNA repair